MRDVGLASLTLVICALAGTAHGEPRRVLVAGDTAAAAARDRGLELASSSELEGTLEELDRRASRARKKALAAITRALERAQDLYLEQEIEAMIDLLSETAREHLWLLGDPDHRELGWAVAFRLGLAHLTRGDREEASRHFALALAISPERRPAADLYGPDVAAAFSRAVAARERRAPRPVRVRAEPAGALIAVDGAGGIGDRRNLRPGLHVLRASAPGYQSRAELVELDGSGRVAIELEADDGSGRVDSWSPGALAPGRPAFDAFWRARMRAAGADAVLWVGKGRAAVVTFDQVLPASGPSSRAAADAALDAWLGEPAIAASESRSITREPLFWGGVAAAVALGVVGVLVLTSDGGDGGNGGGGGIDVGVVDP